MAGRKASLAPALGQGAPTRLEQGVLRIGFPASAGFQRSRADQDAHRAIVAEVASAVFGERLRVVFETIEGSTPDRPAEKDTPPPAILDGDDNAEAWIAGLRGIGALEIEEDR